MNGTFRDPWQFHGPFGEPFKFKEDEMRKTMKLFSLMASIALAGVALPVLAQTAATTPAATPAATMEMSGPSITVGGLVDTYYSYNFTNSSKNMNGHGNVGYSYDNLNGGGGVGLNNADDVFSLGVAEMIVAMKQGDISGVVAIWTQMEEGNSSMNILVANATYAPGQFAFTAGRIADFMGNESFDSNMNWNYSHSLMYNDTLPLWLQGVNIKYAPSKSFEITGYASEGWIKDPGMNMGDYGKTYGLQISLKPDDVWGVKLNGIAGPNNGYYAGVTNPGDSLYVGELIVKCAATTDFSWALDAEYGELDPVQGDPLASLSSETFWGADLYGKLKIAEDWNVALRLEELESSNSWVYNGMIPSVTPYVETREATLTISNQVTKNLLLRLEGRYDMGYTGGTMDSSPDGPYAGGSGDQLTGTGSAVLSF